MAHGQKRDGLFSISKTAHVMCRLLVDFSPVIQKLYPSNTALHAALAAALAACQVLQEETTAQRELGV